MTCREFVEFLWRYFDGDLSPVERSTFDRHLAECPECTRYLQQYQDSVRIGKAVLVDDDAPVPAEVPEELVQAILKSRAHRVSS